jgi:hypothetical protein
MKKITTVAIVDDEPELRRAFCAQHAAVPSLPVFNYVVIQSERGASHIANE